jgi:tetratricopeptide (TPR) repeat protein
VNSIRAIVACSLLAAAASSAAAQPAGAQAEVLYDEGRALMTAGKTAEACAAFAQSQKLDPQLTTLIALGTCHEKLGQIATAWGLFLEVERQTRSATDRLTRDLRKTAVDRAANLEPRVSKLTISVPDKSKLDQLEIVRGDESIPPVMWNRALPIDGGSYTVIARAPGSSAWSTKVTIKAEGDVKTVDIPDLRTFKRDLVPTEAAKRNRRILPFVVGGSAVVLLGGALGFSLLGRSTYDKAEAEMVDQERRDSLYDSANSKLYAAQAFAVAGAGCAGVAVWLYLRNRRARPESSAAQSARLLLAPMGSGAGVVGQF